MKKLLLKLLQRLLFDDVVPVDGVDMAKMTQWLFKAYEDKGFRSYYTLRKKTIKDVISLGVSRKDYWRSIGRLEELKALSENVKTEYARKKKEQHNAIKKGTK